jgi:histidinol phosphatase-like PHP family hydrolase
MGLIAYGLLSIKLVIFNPYGRNLNRKTPAMIDLHTHSLFSDGVLIPAELVKRAEHIGYSSIGITDHVDQSNLDFVVPRIAELAETLNKIMKIKIIPGVELTHIPPSTIAELAGQARNLGAKLIVVHGETIVEPVPPGTDHHAIEADVDILAHPGLISPKDVKLAATRGVFIEITARKGHSLTNGHVAKLAVEMGAKLVLNTDTHEPSDLITIEHAINVIKGAGLSADQAHTIFANSEELVDRII